MTGKTTINEFINSLSSKQPVPGGGGASALGGAIGTALGEMVANLTIGKKKYAEAEPEIRKILLKLEALQVEFIALADADAEVFGPLAASYGMPSGTEEEKAKKAEVMERNLLSASKVPLRIMEKTIEVLKLLSVLEEKGSRIAVSDVGVGVQFIRAALTGAVMNVYINTKSMADREKAGELNSQAKVLVDEGCRLADEIYRAVLLDVGGC